jgi:signal transduction histidine kinase
VLQESLVDVAKHAQASQVWVSLETDDGLVTLRIP